MRHLVWLVVILGMSANAETFRMVQKGFYPALRLEVSCNSDTVEVSIAANTTDIFSSKSRYEIGGRTMSLRELGSRQQYDYDNGTTMVIGKPFIQTHPVDIWFWGGRYTKNSPPVANYGCGGHRVEPTSAKYCHQIRTSGSLRWSKIDQIQNEPPRIVRFSVSRDTLWEFLRRRQELSDHNDQGISLLPENEFLELRLWRVDDPNVKLIALGDRVGRRQARTEQTQPKIWTMYGKARASDGFHLVDPYRGIDWTKIPDEISEELNRLQDYYNGCPVAQASPPPPPARERPPLDYSATTAREFLKIMKIVDSVWDDYKDMTLEEYVNLP